MPNIFESYLLDFSLRISPEQIHLEERKIILNQAPVEHLYQDLMALILQKNNDEPKPKPQKSLARNPSVLNAHFFRFAYLNQLYEMRFLEILTFLFLIISSGKIFFQPNIEANEEVATAHFLDLELGGSGAAIAPCNGHDGVGVTPHDRLEGQFDSNVKMRG